MDSTDDTDQAEPDLAQLLVLVAGRLMENLSPDLAMRLPRRETEKIARLKALHRTSDDITTLLLAAAILEEHRHDWGGGEAYDG